jgi:lambda family phage portal protein
VHDPLATTSVIVAPAESRTMPGTARHAPASATGPRGRNRIVSRYDSAQTVGENARHWAWADGLSARSANSASVRTTLRNRSRYETANNSYARGIVLTLANDLIGPGPRLQMLTKDTEANRRIEVAFQAWAVKVKLAKKLRTMRQAKIVDGEAFAVLDTDPNLGPVQLDIQLFEADQFSDPSSSSSAILPDSRDSVDGIILDSTGKPAEYHLLRAHPGDNFRFDSEYDRIPARYVIHWFREDRPGQYRGIPELTPALPLFAILRRYTLAVLTAAETAANFAAVIESDLPPEEDDENQPVNRPFDLVDIERNMMTTLPTGWKMNQFKPEQPTTTYAMFKHEILDEAAMAILLPHGVGTGDMSDYNYSSGRLAHQIYHRCLGVDQSELESEALDRIFAEWLAEAARTTDLIPGGMAGLDREGGWPHCWLWQALAHVDPQKEANAQETLLRNGMTTFSDECQAAGADPEQQVQIMAADLELFKKYGLAPPAWAVPVPPKTQAPSPEPGDAGNADPNAEGIGRTNGHALEGLVRRNGRH